MRRFKRLLAVAVPLATVFSVMAPTPSPAATYTTGTAAVTGSGTIHPGLTPSPNPQSVTFTGTVVGTVTTAGPPPQTAAFALNCTFSGASNNGPVITGDSAATGQGNVTGSCTGTATVTPPGVTVTVTVTCTLKYYRVTGGVVVTGNCTIVFLGNSHHVCVTGELVFVPLNVNPTTAYQLAGDITITPPKNKTPCPKDQKL